MHLASSVEPKTRQRLWMKLAGNRTEPYENHVGDGLCQTMLGCAVAYQGMPAVRWTPAGTEQTRADDRLQQGSADEWANDASDQWGNGDSNEWGNDSSGDAVRYYVADLRTLLYHDDLANHRPALYHDAVSAQPCQCL
ncbi:hypothetical protein ANO11243_028640 [Dothideomycetidae sp. 11243]|nr:hypothetical protein ANO11243_028640 [fungal sp. No.11243]